MHFYQSGAELQTSLERVLVGRPAPMSALTISITNKLPYVPPFALIDHGIVLLCAMNIILDVFPHILTLDEE